MISLKQKRAQITLSDAPMVVMIVGLTFLIMATVALVGEKYQDSFSAGETSTVSNETMSSVTETPVTFATVGQCNYQNFILDSAVGCTNSTGATLEAANYTIANNAISFTSTTEDAAVNNTDWLCSYTYDYTGITCNVTTDLNTELANNTSIAGIVLTISLVGIVLTVLIGVFVGMRKGI